VWLVMDVKVWVCAEILAVVEGFFICTQSRVVVANSSSAHR